MTYFRPNIEQMHGYVPGEQPKIPGLIKLNTNENPYPPPPKVLAALREALCRKVETTRAPVILCGREHAN